MKFNFYHCRVAGPASQTIHFASFAQHRRFLVGYRSRAFLAALLALLLPITQVAAQSVPGAGSILQQDRPVKPLVPSPADTGMTFKLEGGAELPDSPPFVVTTIQITGNTVYDTPTLRALVAEAEGQTLTLPQLAKVVNRITDYYRDHGYLLARAVVPAQVIRDGVVRIVIIEARYGKVKLDNRSRVSDTLLQDTLAPLHSDDVVTKSKLDRALLLASDIPGVAANATLSPGEQDGTSDLNVQANATPAVNGNAALDNDGNRYTGRTRVGATLNLVAPMHHGDVLSVNALSSGKDMNYASLSFDTLLNGMGIHLGGSYSELHYTLGDTLASLDGHGTAQEKMVWMKAPVVRSQAFNLYGQLQFDHKQLNDEIDVTSLHTDRHLESWNAILTGDLRDSLFSGGTNTWSINWSGGRVLFDDAGARVADAATAKTQGRYTKWNWNLARLQNLGQNDALYLAFSGQSANVNLDSSEKMLAGGPYSVRAFDIGALSADAGNFESIEYRHYLGEILRGYWTMTAFVDREHVSINKNTWAPGANSANLTGAGVGLNWAGPDLWAAKAYVATPIGSLPALLGATKSTRAWVDINKGF